MAPRIKPEPVDELTSAAAAALGRRGGLARAAALTKAQRVAIATKASRAANGWPKGKRRGPSPLKGRKVTR